MLSLLITCLIAGGIGAILQGMLGIGTGIIIVPLLTFILPHYGVSSSIAIHIALGTSMAAIAINSISALISHYQHGNIKWYLVKRIILFSITGSFIGALLASHTPGRYLENIFGVFLILNAIYMMLFKKPVMNIADVNPAPSFPKIAIGGFGIGLVASIIGSGGGILMVPFLNSLQLNMRYAVGTSTLIGLPVAVVGAITYILLGLTAMPHTTVTFGYLHWPALLAITIAGIVCVPVGVKLTTVLPTLILQRIFAVCMLLVGTKMLIQIYSG